MQLNDVTRNILGPALSWLPKHMDTPQARVMLLTIGLQESRFLFRRQLGNGPAASFWQMERGGGVLGVLTHKLSRPLALDACKAHNVAPDSLAVWTALQTNDVLGATFARLLMFTDPPKLPALDDPQAAWDMYALRVWRPGKPRRDTWDAYHVEAVAEVVGAAA